MSARRRYAGVDPGRVRVGLAVADEEHIIALARGSVSGDGSPVEVAKRIGAALADASPTNYVVGLPLGLDGSEGTSAKFAKRLARAIRDTLGVKVVMLDERLTTAQATRSLRELGVTGRDARKSVDAAAASVLLQTALDRRKSREWRNANEPQPSDEPRLPREKSAKAETPSSSSGEPTSDDD